MLLVRFDFGSSEVFQFGTDLTWIPAIGSNYHIGIDGISLPMLVLSTFITVLAIIYSWNHWPEPHNPKAFLALILLLATGMAGTFVALDLILFFIFFELVLLPMYFMIGIWGDRTPIRLPGFKREVETRLYASIKFFLFTLFGSAFMLLGFLAHLLQVAIPHTFDIVALHEAGVDGRVRRDVRGLGVRRPVPRASPSRCRCGRCTPGSPTPTPQRPRSARCCWLPSS